MSIVPIDAGNTLGCHPSGSRAGCGTVDNDPLSAGLDLTALEAECIELSPNVVIEKKMENVWDHLTVIRQKIPGKQPQSTLAKNRGISSSIFLLTLRVTESP
jgi:hypothetical protein